MMYVFIWLLVVGLLLCFLGDFIHLYFILFYFIMFFFGRFYIYVFSQKLITRVDFNSCKTKRKKEKRKQFKQQQKSFGSKKWRKLFFLFLNFLAKKTKTKKL